MKTLAKLLSVAAIALALAYPLVSSGGGDSAAPPSARQLVAGGAQLLDVRTAAEFSAGHIAGALNIPVEELERRIGEVGPKERAIVVYCRSGRRSAQAARILDGAGYRTVHDIGAMSSW